MTRPQYTPWQVRHGSQDIPVLRPITVKVADVSDASAFPEIAAAIEWARKRREGQHGQ